MDEPKKRLGWLRQCGFASVLLAPPLLLLLLYGGAYFANCHRFTTEGGGGRAIPVYGRIFGPSMPKQAIEELVRHQEFRRKFFGPAHAVDRMIRPKYWMVR